MIQYDKLMTSISSLFIVNSYTDSVNVGKDDSIFDYYNIFYLDDFYLKACIDKCLEEKLLEVTKEKTLTKFCYSHDRGIARYPRKGIYYGGSSNLFRMWLYANTVKYYNQDSHLLCLKDFRAKGVYQEIWKETQIAMGEIKKYDDYYTINLTVEKNTLGHKIETILFTVADVTMPPEDAKDYYRNLLIEKYYDENSIDVSKYLLVVGS